jgi:4-amino-4-deoxy-L-arabinose transferase-like glycosyltransferase
MPPPGPRRPPFSALSRPPSLAFVTALAVAALLTLFWWLAVSASREKSQTSDELPHLAAGYAYNRFGDFRFQPENGNLPQRLHGLAGLAAEARFPTDTRFWNHSAVWQIGWDYLYGLDNPTDRIVQNARALNALFGVALGLLIFFLARAQFGDIGGLLALGFYTFAPNFLAHSALATSDVCAAFFLTLAPWLFWRHLGQRTLASGLLAGLATGLTLVAKFNGVLLAPIFALLGVADLWLHARSPEIAATRRLAANVALALAQAAAGLLVIWAFYNFRYSASAPGTPEFLSFSWDGSAILDSLGAKRPIVETALRWHLLPEAWLQGFAFVLASESARAGFFAGEHSQYGWWQFFPTLFLTKTPLATLGALLLALLAGIFALRRAAPTARRAALVAACPLAVTAAVVGFTALRSHLNIGDRHILALYPTLFVALGLLATRRTLLAAALVLLVGQAAASFSARPHYLASFNSLIGGPAHAYRLFVDSSLDWGQDLPSLRAWLSGHRRPDEKIYLGYFGNAWPPHYGVRPDHFLPSASYIVRPPHLPYPLEPGLYCISATTLAEVYSDYRGAWNPAREQLWQGFLKTPPTAENYQTFDELRFARLCKHLQLREPNANAGHSILIYRLTPADLSAALESPPPTAAPSSASAPPTAP